MSQISEVGHHIGDGFDRTLIEHHDVVEQSARSLREPFVELVSVCAASIRAGGKLLFFGNGGSAADAQHLATELVVRFVGDRQPIAALALTTDSSALTAIGNDMGFDELFARQIAALGRERDVAIGISTSGNSENVLKGLRQAKSMGMIAAGLTGCGGGRFCGLADPLLVAPSRTTARIQEVHLLIGHMLCAALEEELGLV